MKLAATTLLTVGLAFATSQAFAAGTSSPAVKKTPPVTGKMTSPMQMHCKAGEVVKTMKKNGHKMKACVKATAGIIPDDELYSQAWLLAKTGEYDWALTALNAVVDKHDADVLNMMGYSNRKAGRLEVGISYYAEALALKPDLVRAREYLGEGYVAAGRVDLAKVQLNEIANRCGVTCEEYQDLSKVIAGKATEL